VIVGVAAAGDVVPGFLGDRVGEGNVTESRFYLAGSSGRDFPAGQPFGGYKQSGTGREIGQEAVEHYTQTKSLNVSLD